MLPTGTITFLFTDIQGSTALWEQEPEKMAEALQTHNATLRQVIETHGGVVFKTVGDEFQAAFPTAPQALRAAIAGQRALGGAVWNELGELRVRMGLHTGEAELDPAGDEYAVSHTKNRVARIMSVAHGGQTLLSQESTNLLLRGLPEDVFLKDLGEHHLKGMAFPEHLYQACVDGLPQDFPPLATATIQSHNLPLQLTSFIGREREISDVARWLETNRLVTLLGPGGTGKTRLALRVAEEVLAQYPHGVWFVELARVGSPELVASTIAATLGIPEPPAGSPLDQLKNHLRTRNALLILDNCEHVIAECAGVSETLLRDCSKLKILASSREALRLAGEVTYQVPSLAVPDPQAQIPVEQITDFSALMLFAERASAVDPGFEVSAENLGDIAQICRRLDGIPLAIELAAARASALTAEQIAARLDNRFRLLTSGSRTAMPRQQTLRASIDWSYSLLEESERLLLMRLSVFHCGWTLEMASDVCGFDELDEFDVLDGLSQLVNKSLIQSTSGTDESRRYRQLETIREYAREKLLERGASKTVLNRHLDAFLTLAEVAEPQLRGHHQVEWLDRLEEELDNLRAALEWALDEEPEKGLRLATSVFWFWNNRGPRVEGESWLRRLRERLEQSSDVDVSLLAIARARQAHLQMSIGRLGKEVTQTAGEALALAESLGEDGRRIQAIALWVLAISKKHVGYYSAAHRFGRQCLELAVALKDRFMIAESYEALIDVESDPISARHFAEKHLALRREMGDLDGQMMAYMDMATNEFWSGDLDQACNLCEKGMEIAGIVKNRWGLAMGHSILGYIFRASGEMDKAIEHLQRALSVVQDTGEQGRVIRQLNALGSAYGTRGDWSQAECHLQEAIHVARNNRFALWEIISCISLAEVACTFDHSAVALAYYKAAADVDRSQEYAFLDGLIAYGHGKASLLRDDPRTAGDCFRQALKVSAETGNRRVMKYSLQALGVCAVLSGNLDRAIRLHGSIKARNWLLWPLELPWLVPHDLANLLGPARHSLGIAAYDHLLAEGQAMASEATVAFALEA